MVPSIMYVPHSGSKSLFNKKVKVYHFCSKASNVETLFSLSFWQCIRAKTFYTKKCEYRCGAVKTREFCSACSSITVGWQWVVYCTLNDGYTLWPTFWTFLQPWKKWSCDTQELLTKSFHCLIKARKLRERKLCDIPSPFERSCSVSLLKLDGPSDINYPWTWKAVLQSTIAVVAMFDDVFLAWYSRL